jgi:hypothetical protein
VVGAGRFAPAGRDTIDVPPIQLTVADVDYSARTARLESPPPADLLGERGVVVRARTGPHSASYTIRSINHATIGFGEIGLITGRFLGAWDASTSKLVARERIDGAYTQFHGRSFVGMTVVNEDLSTTATITGFDCDARTFTTDADAADAAKFTDCDGDDRPYIYIADIAPGTTLEATPAKVVSWP